MSFNQSRPNKNDSGQYHKSVRSASFNNPRGSSGGYGRGGGGAPVPSPSVSYSSAANSRSFKKPGYAQGGQPRGSFSTVNHHPDSANAAPNVHGGAPSQLQARGGSSNAPVTSTVSKTAEATSAPPRGTQTVPKAPASQPTTMTPNSTAPSTPAKAPGDQSKGYLQFGSISPNFVSGMLVPPRTSSAPPNIDEQKRDQAHNDPVKVVPPVPIPPAKQHLPKKDSGSANNSSVADTHSVTKTKETQTQSFSHVSQAPSQKPQAHQVPRMSMPTYQQPPVPVKFSVPKPQIQSQGFSPVSLQSRMQNPRQLPVANAPPQVQQQMFSPGLQPHQMPLQRTLHQGQGLSFNQLPHMGNLDTGIAQYPQQQGGQFGGPRKNYVKITDPRTHQEVRLDKPSDTLDGGSSARSHPNGPPQSQPMHSYPPGHPFNYYPNYNPAAMYFPGAGSLLVAGGQINPASQAPRFEYSVSQGPQSASFMNPMVSNASTASRTVVSNPGTPEQSRQDRVQISRDGTSSTSSVTGEALKKADISVNRNVAGASSVHSATVAVKIEAPKPIPSVESSAKESEVRPGSSPKPGAAREPLIDSSSLMTEHNPVGASSVFHSTVEPSTSSAAAKHSTESAKGENYGRSNSMKNLDEHGKTEDVSQPQVERDPPPLSSLPSHATVPRDVNEGVAAEENSFSGSGTTGIISESASHSIGGADPSCISEMRNSPVSLTPEITDVEAAVKLDEPFQQQDDKIDKEIVGGETERTIEDADGTTGSGNFGHEPGSSLVKSSEVKECKQESISNVQASVESISKVSPVKSNPDEATRKVDSEISSSLIADVTVTESVPGTVFHSAETNSSDITSLSAPESEGGSIISEKLTGTTDGSALKLQEKDRLEDDVHEKSAVKGGSMPISSSNNKPLPELNRPKSATAKGMKKRRELLLKADAAGSTLDLYMAYRGPEEKKETMVSSVSAEITSPSAHPKAEHTGSLSADAAPSDDADAEPDDWEDAADISTPKLQSATVENPVIHPDDDMGTAKKYSRDFLMKFAEQFTSLPENFEVTSDIADVFSPGLNISSSAVRDHHPSPGRLNTGPRLDRRGSNVRGDDRWMKGPGAFAPGNLDVFGGNSGFRPAQGANYGVLRNPRVQSPVQYHGGILPGLMQAPGSQGGLAKTGSDADRWQRATNFQKGLMPSPQTPMQVMHKAKEKYEVGKVTDEEQAKQRQLKAILNKLTPQNFEKLFEQVIGVQIDSATTLRGLISQIFDKALLEPTFCEMYANLCSRLSLALPDFQEDNVKITFKRLLLNKCQEEFERGEREQEEADKVEEEGEVKQTKEEREEKRIKARRRMLGNIRLIGELYKKRMLTEKIMHECMKKLLGQHPTQIPDEEDLESLCKLMSTIGEMIDHPKAKSHMDVYFERMTALSNNMALSSRVRFMLKDAIDLRKNKWQQRRKVEGPKKIEEVHRDAQQERHGQAGRLGRAPGINNSGRRGQQMEFTRGNPLSSPNAQMAGFRGLPAQTRGFGSQDARFEERQAYEPRPLSVPLSQRSMGDDAITLGPQGGLGRGMSGRGPASISAGLNGFSSLDRTNSYSSREDSAMRSAADRYIGPGLSDHINVQGSREIRSPRYSSDRPSSRGDRPSSRGDRPSSRGDRPSSRGDRPSSRGNNPTVTHDFPSERPQPEEKLQQMSIAAIREYYGAKDEKEVSQCIKELNTPSFYSSMVSIWVMDSFERKDMERDLLTKLLINLSSPESGILSRGQLIEGFESVLTTLEDAVNDAPKAPVFLGRLFGKVIAEDVVSLSEIGQILREGGEEQGQLLEAGLAADVLGYTLDAIQFDKGEVALSEIRKSSNLLLEDFRPPAPMKSMMLEKFI